MGLIRLYCILIYCVMMVIVFVYVEVRCIEKSKLFIYVFYVVVVLSYNKLC